MPTITIQDNKLLNEVYKIARQHKVGKTIEHISNGRKGMSLYYHDWKVGFRLYIDLIGLYSRYPDLKVTWLSKLMIVEAKF